MSVSKSMEIVQVKIVDLISSVYNPRKISETQLDDLKESIEEFGLVDPIIVNSNKDRNNIIIGGHQRVLAATSLGYDKIPVVYLDLSEEKEKELNVRLNKNIGEWDWDLLGIHFDNDLLKDIGFSEEELNIEIEGVIQDEGAETSEKEVSVDDLGLSKKCPKCNYEW